MVVGFDDISDSQQMRDEEASHLAQTRPSTSDNELYHFDNVDDKTHSISVFVFDQQYFRPTKSSCRSEHKTVWCGPHAAQALIEAVTCLRDSIRSIGGELLVRCGDPCIIVPQIAKDVGATEIVFHEEPGTYERGIVQTLQQHYMFDSSVKLCSRVGYTLYHPNDLPFDPNKWDQLAHPKQQQSKKRKKKKQHHPAQIKSRNGIDFDLVDVSPERFRGINRIMGDFRKAARSAAEVRQVLDAPKCLRLPPDFDPANLEGGRGLIPSLEELMSPLSEIVQSSTNSILGVDSDAIQFVIQSAIDNRGRDHECRGEKAALDRLDSFVDNGHAATADRSRADVSDNDSSRLSVHLSLGTLSPRTAYWKAKRIGDEGGCDWIASHLEMRDFFLYTAFANGSRLYGAKGIPVGKKRQQKVQVIQWNSPKDDADRWARWATGKTQLPLIDAAMKELMTTGYCSNRVRQNAASVLTKDLRIDWRAGADWFQFLLEDHCVGANFGNWLYFSGVGPDPKNRHFRTVSQMKRYDARAEYVRRWVPGLANVEDAEHALRPWDFGIPGFDSPIVDPRTQYTWQDMQLLESTGKLLD
eukprot:CAMPEP_0197463748 /NCGR_PEP_ID=MMETSP1175-20131217/62660_1 /TAXON_ID=1003142 /ORGANISM="Triceratium dubium, Strain CCMP147" /LENGTH=582 /DNA_ID=CAMNT_0042999589 /DNA_START=137 /DNA_END=1886 /DNA_ORIENTATION=-